MNRFNEKCVLVTGGGGGFGRAIAAAFAEAGAKVAVAGRDERKLEETVERIGSAGGTAVALRADVSVEADVENLVEGTVAALGGLDVDVNNAGMVGREGPLTGIDLESWEDVFRTNVTGVWLCLKHEMSFMREHGGGAIVNTASNIGAHTARPNMAAYGASKAAVSALTKVAALEGIADGIRVNAISPGASDTPMSMRPGETEDERAERIASTIPVGRLGALEELASAVLWLAGEDGGFAVGHDFVIDGGASL
jgi:NAD(P)-dependent dehydrogenase (short-subunit alcohol dehydrogenase family)